MPDFEFWFSGAAFWGAAGFVFTAVLAVISIKPLGHVIYRPAILLLPVIAAGIWHSLAQSEAEKAKPQRDYVYFALSTDPRDINGESVALISRATGPLKDVKVAIQSIDDRNKGSRRYLFYHEFSSIDEGGTLLGIFVAPGDYMIDSDPPTKLGKVLERLEVEKIDGRFVSTIRVIRKESQELLIPPPETISFVGRIVLIVICLAFAIFAAVLGWASLITA